MNLPIGETVQLAVLDLHRQTTYPATVLACDGRNLALLADMRPALGAAVRLAYEDAVLLGEVSYCAPHNGGVRIGVWLQERLTEVSQLERLVRAILESDDSGGRVNAPVSAPRATADSRSRRGDSGSS